jgi:radical SAM protein with 4Fe4S-binding SPASM domain
MQEELPLELFKKIIDESEGNTTLKLNYSGEPLLYPHLIEAIKYAKDKGVIEIRFNTNADLLDTDMMRKLIRAGLDRILISDYDQDDLKEKIVKFEALKQLMGNTNPIIVLQHIMFDDFNCQEWIDKWSEIETLELGFQEYFDYLRMPLNLEESDFQCAFLWQRMLVLSNGDVYSCCGMPHKKKLLGNIRYDTITELWHGEIMTEFRRLHKEKKSEQVLPCALCPMRDKMIGVL